MCVCKQKFYFPLFLSLSTPRRMSAVHSFTRHGVLAALFHIFVCFVIILVCCHDKRMSQYTIHIDLINTSPSNV